MRMTVDLPDELHRQAQVIARDTNRTLSETIADLVRRGLDYQRKVERSHNPTTGLPLMTLGRVITSEDVRSLEDEV